MKTMRKSIVLSLMLVAVTSLAMSAQQVSQAEKDKQKEAELKQKQYEEQMKKEQQAAEEEFIRAQKKAMEYEVKVHDYDALMKRAEIMSTKPIVVIPEEGVWNVPSPGIENYYFYGSGAHSSPGSSWNYSRQVLEATFSNEFTMPAGDDTNVNLSIAGDCAEGSITVAIVMPDGKQLSEVTIDENGSLNWRKSFETEEGNGWKNGKWIFRIKAAKATGNFRISMTSN